MTLHLFKGVALLNGTLCLLCLYATDKCLHLVLLTQFYNISYTPWPRKIAHLLCCHYCVEGMCYPSPWCVQGMRNEHWGTGLIRGLCQAGIIIQLVPLCWVLITARCVLWSEEEWQGPLSCASCLSSHGIEVLYWVVVVLCGQWRNWPRPPGSCNSFHCLENRMWCAVCEHRWTDVG